MFLEQVKKHLVKFLGQNHVDIYTGDLVYPENSDLGDLSLPVFKFASIFKKAPAEIARQLANTLNIKKIKFIKKVEALGGYLNFFLDYEIITKEVLGEVLKKGDKFGNAPKNKAKILVESVSPNSNKPLHLGHVRNAVLGEAVARILETQGSKIIRANLVNDRGLHICKAMVAYTNFGKVLEGQSKTRKDSPERSSLKGDHFVGKYYVIYEQELQKNPKLEDEARVCLRNWEKGEKETLKLWHEMRSWVLDGFKETYKALGLHFDRVDYESEIWKNGKEIISAGLNKKIFKKEKDGAIIAPLEKFNLPDKVLLRSDGTSLYITTDLYLAQKRYKEEKFNQVIYVVGSEQDLYFKQLFAIFSLLQAPYTAKARHLSYGMVFLPQGKMKSREGTVVDADDLISKLQAYAREEVKSRHDFLRQDEIDRRSRAIALAALKYYILAVNPPSSMHFNPKEALAFTGKTGPYLLYTLARTRSILRKVRNTKPEAINKSKTVNSKNKIAEYLKEKEERQLILGMAKFPEVLERSAKTLDPEELATYLYNLAKMFSDFYEKHQVLHSRRELSLARLQLVKACANVLDRGLSLLGIDTLEEM